MPQLDQTGPMGRGKLTGRGLGKCNSEDAETKQIIRRGLGRAKGLGCGQSLGCMRGFGRRKVITE